MEIIKNKCICGYDKMYKAGIGKKENKHYQILKCVLCKKEQHHIIFDSTTNNAVGGDL